MRNCESFQHENVFATQLTRLNKNCWNFYLNFTFEVEV